MTGDMAKENNISEEELDKLIMDVLTTKREKYENLSKVLQNLVELSKSINSDMKTLHEDLSEIPWAFDELFSEKKATISIFDVMKKEEIKKMIDSASSIVEQTETMRGYTSSISEDINKILHITHDPEN